MKIRKTMDGDEVEEAEYEFLGFTEAEFKTIKQLLMSGAFLFSNPNPHRFLIESIAIDGKRTTISVIDTTGDIYYAIKNRKKYAVPKEIEYDNNGTKTIIKASTGKATYKIKLAGDGTIRVSKKGGETHPHELGGGEMCVGNSRTPEEFLEALSVINLDSLANTTELTKALSSAIANGLLKESSGWGGDNDD